MNTALRQDADTIIASSLKAVLPDAAVRRALESEAFCPQGGRTLLVAGGEGGRAGGSEKPPVRWRIRLSLRLVV